MTGTARVGVVGASGFAGSEFLRLAAGHPDLDVVLATADSRAGTAVAEEYPSLAAAYPDLVYTEADPAALDGLDLVVLGLPHGLSGAIVPELVGRVGTIVDVAADFRFDDPAVYDRWYGEAHPHPELLSSFVYGLPELFGERLPGADRIAVPGCYPTTAAIALAPLVRAGLVSPVGLVVDAMSGVSGAGAAAKPGTRFSAADGDVKAYGLLTHRHTPEMEMAIGGSVLFTPHLVPMTRGILATCHARPVGSMTTDDLLGAYARAYDGCPFVVVSERPPTTKATVGSNTVHVTARYDERTDSVVAIAALDNLVKGTSGQAIQCWNLATGRDETLGLPVTGLWP